MQVCSDREGEGSRSGGDSAGSKRVRSERGKMLKERLLPGGVRNPGKNGRQGGGLKEEFKRPGTLSFDSRGEKSTGRELVARKTESAGFNERDVLHLERRHTSR